MVDNTWATIIERCLKAAPARHLHIKDICNELETHQFPGMDLERRIRKTLGSDDRFAIIGDPTHPEPHRSDIWGLWDDYPEMTCGEQDPEADPERIRLSTCIWAKKREWSHGCFRANKEDCMGSFSLHKSAR